MNNGNAEFRGLALADPVSLVPQVIPGRYGYWVVYQPLLITPISVYPGDTVRFRVTFQHRGAGTSYGLYCAMGVRYLSIFDEDPRISKTITRSITEHDNWAVITEYGDVPIPIDYTDYGWKDASAAIIVSGDKVLTAPEYDDVVEILERAPEFKSLSITSFEKV